MSAPFDAIVIGAGHNGLTAAAYLARAGLSVVVVEQRDVIGGATVTEEFHPGFRVDTFAHRMGPFSPRVFEDLRLRTYGLEMVWPDPARVAMADGRALSLFRDPSQTAEAIRPFSSGDAARWPAFCRTVADAARLVDAVRQSQPPRLPDPGLRDLLRLAAIGLGLRRRGKRAMAETLRLLPMSLADLLDDWFESDVLKGAVAGAGLPGLMQGPRGAGTAYALLHHLAAGEAPGGVTLVRGGTGRAAEALAGAARAAGVEIRTSAPVERIGVRSDAAVEVVLAGGEVIPARRILSSADPKRTFLTLVGPEALDPAFVRQVRHIRMRGACAKVHLALGELPRFPGIGGGDAELRGAVMVAPGLDYLERAFDDAKYGGVSERPFLEAVIPTLTDPSLAPPGRHVMSILVQYAPYHLKAGAWEAARREALGDAVVAVLAEYAPNLPAAVLHRQVLTPLDLEQRLGLTEGNIFQGEMALDQLFFMRPVPGWARYGTPVRGLYLCGAGAHPGGGVTALPGYHAARAVLRDMSAS
ncbi:MAG: NAD(P)/FAD-dependent oxidoreductase [Gemmatimonadetes bacterium]|nr:NAD(P)/FAD-dependent oxidoreductase [Gemmatimonadota bacterium]